MYTVYRQTHALVFNDKARIVFCIQQTADKHRLVESYDIKPFKQNSLNKASFALKHFFKK